MKRRYEWNLYTPDQYNDLQDHLEYMATRGWELERMEQHFLVYRQSAPGPIHYALAFHPEVGDMDSLRTPALEFYEDLCQQAQWRLVDTWSKYPQIQVYATRQRDPVPLQTDLVTHWSTLVHWMEERYQPRFELDSACLLPINIFLLIFLSLLIFQVELPPFPWLLTVGLALFLIVLAVYRVTATIQIQSWLTQARQAREKAAPGPTGRRTRIQGIFIGLLLWLGGLELLLFLFYLGWSNPPLLAGFFLVLLVNTLTAWLSGKLRRHLRRQETSAAFNWSVFLTVNILLALLCVWVHDQVF